MSKSRPLVINLSINEVLPPVPPESPENRAMYLSALIVHHMAEVALAANELHKLTGETTTAGLHLYNKNGWQHISSVIIKSL